MPSVKFRRDTVATTNALSARQNDLSMVPSCSGEALLEIQATKARVTVQNTTRDAPN